MPIAVTDLDLNDYTSIVIGTQEWIVENWKCTKDRLGNTLTTYYPDNNVANVADYGLLYNWTDAQLLAPTGWHLPSKAEFDTLIDFLGGSLVAGGKLKEVGTTYWNSPNTGADNSSGFSARAAGEYFGSFGDFGQLFQGWLSTDGLYIGSGDNVNIYYNNTIADYGGYPKTNYLSVRLIKDIPTTVTTEAASSITSISATLNGTVIAGETASNISRCFFEFGTTTSYGSILNAVPSIIDSGTLTITPITFDVTNLAAGIIYHYRTKVTNNSGIFYGSDETFTTTSIPSVTIHTNIPENITTSSATLRGTVIVPDGIGVIYLDFYFGGTLIQSDTKGYGGTFNFTYPISGLNPNTQYSYYATYTTSGGLTGNGGVIIFTTSAVIPSSFKPKIFFV